MENILHIYYPKRTLLLLEYTRTTGTRVTSQPPVSSPRNVLLFVGGLYDNFRSPGYVDDLAALFPRDEPGQEWRVMHVQLSSHGKSWGLSDLDRDVEEMAAAISYIRKIITQDPSSPIVLMGFSTGCQDLMHYLVSPASPSSPRPNISGIILAAPVSDREAILHSASQSSSTKAGYEKALEIAASTPKERHKTTIIPRDLTTPLLGPAPMSVARFLSLASPGSPENPSMEDYYSSDLLDQRLYETFGRISSTTHLLASQSHTNIKKSILILQGAVDESIPPSVDIANLISRWKKAIESSGNATLSPHSMIIPHAAHDIAGSSVEARTARLVDMRNAVLSYLEEAVGGVGSGSWAIWDNDMNALRNEAGAEKVERESTDDAKL